MIKVYHWSAKPGGSESAAMSMFFGSSELSSEAWNGLSNDVEYKLVATVDSNDLEVAFDRTNNIDSAWPNNELVTAELNPNGHRSTSSGDVMVNEDGQIFTVSTVGFKPMFEPKRPSPR